MKQKLQTLLIALAAMLMLPLNLWADGVGNVETQFITDNVAPSFPEKDNSKNLSQTSSIQAVKDLLEKVGPSIDNGFALSFKITDAQYQEIKTFTDNLVADITSEADIYKTIFNWIVANVRYEWGENDPYAVFQNRHAVCQGYANLLNVMLHSQGIPVVNINGFLEPLGGHAWNYVYYANKWWVSDPTNNGRYNIGQTKTYEHLVPQSIDIDIFPSAESVYRFSDKRFNLARVRQADDMFVVPYSHEGIRITSFSPDSLLPANVREICLGTNIESLGEEFIGLNHYAPNVERVHIDEKNTRLKTHCGVVYRKNNSQLIYIPSAMPIVELLPIATMGKNYIYNVTGMEELIIAPGTMKLEAYAVENCPKLRRAYIPEDTEIDKNAFYSVHPEFEVVRVNVNVLLQEWWDTNYPEGLDALQNAVGDKVGQYKEESVAGLLSAYNAYINWLIDGVGGAAEILAQSKAAYEDLKINEMTEGYYYIVAKRNHSGVMDDNGVMRGVENFEIPRKNDASIDVTLESSRYLWHFTEKPEKGTYIIKNFGTGKYVKIATHNDNTGIKTSDFADAVDYTVVYSEEYPGTVIFKHFNDKGERDCSWNYFHGNGKVISNWYPENDGNSFFLYNVDEALVEAIAEEVAQYELQELYDNAVSSYQRGIAYEPAVECTRDDNFSNHGLLTYEKDEEGNPVLDEEGNVISNMKILTKNGENAVHPSDGFGSVVGLLDDKWDTFTHTVWDTHTVRVGSPYPQYFEIDLGEGNELDAIALKLMRRTCSSEHNASFGIGEAIVYARNSVEEEWVRVANLAMTYDINLYARDENGEISVDEEGNPVLQSWSADNGENYVGIGAAGLGAKYRYLRLQHYKTLSTTSSGVQQNVYFSASEMALFGATYAPEKSLNSAVPTDILAAIETEMAKAKAELEAGKATAAQIAALQKAYDEFLANFPEPKRLKDALAAAKTLAEGLPIETEAGEVGFYPQAALDAFNAVVAEVEATVEDVMTLAVINNGIAKLDAAKTELLKSLNMFASGFYQVKMAGGAYQEALLHSSRFAADTKDVKGLRAEFAKQTGNIDEGLVDDENYINKVSSVWHFEVGEGNKVAIRSLANGLYLQPVLAQSNFVQMTPEKVWLEIQADGLVNGGLYNIILGNDTTTATKGRPLYANISSFAAMKNGYLMSWYGANGVDNSTLKFEEVDLANFAYGDNTFVLGTNKTQFFTLPYDAVMYGQSAKVCEVEGYFEDPETGEQAIYFKNIQEDGAEIKAGQAYLVQTDSETDFLTVTFEEEEVTGFNNFNYSYEAKEVNGLQATIFSTQVGPKFGILNLANRVVATENTEENGEVVETTIAPLSGYINPANLPVLTSAPKGDEYVKIISLTSFDIPEQPEQPEVPEEPGESEYIELVEGTNFANGMTREVAQVSYNRTLPNLKWNALYLPVEIPVSELRDNYDVAYFNNMHAYDRNNDGTVDEMDMEIFFITEGTLHANHPYFIRAKNNAAKQMNLVLTDVTLHSTEAANCTSITTSSAYMNFELKGVYKRIYVSNTNIPVNPNPEAPISNDYDSDESIYGCYAITASGAWSPIAVGSYLNPFRLYLKMTDRDGTPVKMDEALQTIRIRVHGEDGTTDIEEHCINGQQSTTIYDLQGRRVVNPAKGIYIVNGKKVMIK